MCILDAHKLVGIIVDIGLELLDKYACVLDTVVGSYSTDNLLYALKVLMCSSLYMCKYQNAYSLLLFGGTGNALYYSKSTYVQLSCIRTVLFYYTEVIHIFDFDYELQHLDYINRSVVGVSAIIALGG
jgi:hypothetical protein